MNNVKDEESLWWLVGINLTSHWLNLTSHKITYFTSRAKNFQTFGQKLALNQ